MSPATGGPPPLLLPPPSPAPWLVSENLRDRPPCRARGLQKELLAQRQQEAPNNPRLAWARGATEFYTPAQLGGSQSKAIETYRAGLEAAKGERVSDALDPSWGQPELLMNLAFANLNRTDPDVAAADRYASEALALVPYWHYIRDILIPQIETAKKASLQKGNPPAS